VQFTASLEDPYSTSTASLNVAGIAAVAAAMLFHLVLGTLYCWGSFQSYAPAYLKNYSGEYDPKSGNTPDLVQVLPITLLFQAISFPFGSVLADRLGPRPVVLLSGTIMGSGLVLSSYATSLVTFTILYAGLLGTGIGLGYTGPMVNGFKHFPERKGLISGLIAGAFGCGGFIFNNIGASVFNPDGLSAGKDKLMPSEVTDVFGDNLRRLATVYLFVALIATPFIRTPKEAGVAEATMTVASQPSSTVMSALRTQGFWIMWLSIALASQGGLYVGSSYKEIAYDSDNSDLKCDSYLVMVGALGALTNGLCRPLWGMLYDRIGFRSSFSLAAIMHVILYFCFPMFTSSPHLYLFGVALSFAGFAGFCALVPAEAYRAYSSGIVLGLFVSAFAFAGVFGTKFTDFVKHSFDESSSTLDTEEVAFRFLSLMSLIAVVLIQFYGRR
jgi:MFS family permease